MYNACLYKYMFSSYKCVKTHLNKKFILQKRGKDMCTYWENAVKEFFNLRGKNWNEIKEQLAKANCSSPGELETAVSIVLTEY